MIRSLTASVAATVALVGLVGAPPTTAAPRDTVRVIHLTLDSLHPSQVGADTPVLASLKEQGVWYEQARGVMASETLPNHVAMATGTYPGRNGIPGNDGRAEVGDDQPADPDLGQPQLLQADSLITAIERSCPDLRTVQVFSKQYVHRIFATDPADAIFPQERFNIPGSGHAPDTATVGYLVDEIARNEPDHVFANLGDIDRSGHVDATGATDAAAEQRAVIAQTDTLLGMLVEELRGRGLWEDTVLVLSSDHSMDWSVAGDPAANVDVAGALEADPRTSGRFFVSNNGGAALVYLERPDARGAARLLVAAREVILGLDGVDEALYRVKNPRDRRHHLGLVHPDWQLHGTDRAGELFVTMRAGYRAGSVEDNPLPGNHGHAITRHITMLVTGGWDGLSTPRSIAPSDPGAVDERRLDDTAALPEQAEQVDLAPTFGWLLGVPDPGVSAGGRPQWQGRVLREAFARRPEPACQPAANDEDERPGDDAPGGPLAGAGGGPEEAGTVVAGAPVAGAPAEGALPSTGGGALTGAVGALVLGLATRIRRRRG